MSAIKGLQYEPRCTVCQYTATNKKFHNRILASRKFFPSNKQAETLKFIADTYKFEYITLTRHVQKHVVLNPEEVLESEMSRLSKRAEASVQLNQLEYNGGPKATDVWNEVMEKAREGLEDGTIKLNANHLLKAAKDKSDFEIKKKNQDMAIQEMMWHFASGEALGSTNYDRRVIQGETADDYDPTEVFARFIDQGEDGSSSVHPGTTGDASSSRSDKVLEGDDF